MLREVPGVGVLSPVVEDGSGGSVVLLVSAKSESEAITSGISSVEMALREAGLQGEVIARVGTSLAEAKLAVGSHFPEVLEEGFPAEELMLCYLTKVSPPFTAV